MCSTNPGKPRKYFSSNKTSYKTCHSPFPCFLRRNSWRQLMPAKLFANKIRHNIHCPNSKNQKKYVSAMICQASYKYKITKKPTYVNHPEQGNCNVNDCIFFSFKKNPAY